VELPGINISETNPYFILVIGATQLQKVLFTGYWGLSFFIGGTGYDTPMASG
jgi:hypothetical protein